MKPGSIVIDAQEGRRDIVFAAQHHADGLDRSAVRIGFPIWADQKVHVRRSIHTADERRVTDPAPRKGARDMDGPFDLEVT